MNISFFLKYGCQQGEIKFSRLLHIGENFLNEACTEASERAGAHVRVHLLWVCWEPNKKREVL